MLVSSILRFRMKFLFCGAYDINFGMFQNFVVMSETLKDHLSQ